MDVFIDADDRADAIAVSRMTSSPIRTSDGAIAFLKRLSSTIA
jgi:hypothetical protein